MCKGSIGKGSMGEATARELGQVGRFCVSVFWTSGLCQLPRTGAGGRSADLKAIGHNAPASYTMQYVNYWKPCNYW